MIRNPGHLLCVLLLSLSDIGMNCANAAAPETTVDNPAVTQAVVAETTMPETTMPETPTALEKATAPEAAGQASPSQQVSRPIIQSESQTPVKNGRAKVGEFSPVSAPDIGGSLIQVTLGLFVVLMIIAASAWFTRRFGHFQATAGGSLRIIGGLHVGAKERLVVVQVGEEQLLLGVAPGRISKLHLLAKPINESSEGVRTDGRIAKRAPVSFREYLTAVLKRDST
jgi:flagellar protein FliO/FliZ